MVLLGDFQAPSEKDTIKKALDWGCDLSTWHADPLIRKVCLSMRCCEFLEDMFVQDRTVSRTWKICVFLNIKVTRFLE